MEPICPTVLNVGPDGTILACAGTLELALGWQLGELIGRPLATVLPQPDPVRLGDGPLGATTPTEIVQLRRRDGSDAQVALSACGWRCGSARITTLLLTPGAAIVPLPRPHPASARFERLRLLSFEGAPAAMFTCEPSGRLINANIAFSKLLGYEQTEIGTTNCLQLIHPDERAQGRRLIERLRKGETIGERLEQRCVRKDGSILHGVLHWGAMRDAEGQTTLLLAQIEDPTERTRFEEDARQHREHLAHVTRLSALGEMAAGIAHEVNQPLTAIATYAQACLHIVAAGHSNARRLGGTLEKISREAHRAGEVIRRLRNLARRSESNRDLVEVNELVREAVRLGKIDAHMHNLGIEVIPAPGDPTVIVDPVLIEQVLLNLIRNGIEAMENSADPGDVTVEIDTIGRDFAEIRVSDRGSGIGRDIADEVFKPFYTTKARGMGMGLSISRSIVAAHGGKMWFSANGEMGTRFHFTLPLTPRLPQAKPVR